MTILKMILTCPHDDLSFFFSSFYPTLWSHHHHIPACQLKSQDHQNRRFSKGKHSISSNSKYIYVYVHTPHTLYVHTHIYIYLIKMQSLLYILYTNQKDYYCIIFFVLLLLFLFLQLLLFNKFQSKKRIKLSRIYRRIRFLYKCNQKTQHGVPPGAVTSENAPPIACACSV